MIRFGYVLECQAIKYLRVQCSGGLQVNLKEAGLETTGEMRLKRSWLDEGCASNKYWIDCNGE